MAICYNIFMENKEKGVETMKGMTLPKMMPRPKNMTTMPAKHEHLIRRTPNRNLHVITHHGKIQVGRKGRTV